MNSLVEELNYELRNSWPDTGIAFDQGIRSKEHHRPNYLGWMGFAYTCGMASEKICLKLSEISGSDFQIGKSTKSCIDAVDYLTLSEQLFKNCSAPYCSRYHL